MLHQQDLLHPPHPLHPPSQAAHKATLEDKKALIDKVDCFIFDCDGVIWRGDSVIEGVPETLDMLRAKVGVPGRGGGVVKPGNWIAYCNKNRKSQNLLNNLILLPL